MKHEPIILLDCEQPSYLPSQSLPQRRHRIEDEPSAIVRFVRKVGGLVPAISLVAVLGLAIWFFIHELFEVGSW